ncbi:ClC family H(+)/Cl(-) exchange transporter [Fusobacteria bacterium ZRK30]|nr:ClC family H(+)/Cl(-) exchange transporter [Fusobacteria bacterium ZRK30]
MKLDNLDELIQNKNVKLYLLSILIGLFTGLVVVAYRASLTFITNLRIETFSKITLGNYHLFGITIIAFIFTAILLNKLITKYPMIKGSGIPQIKGVLLMQFEFNWIKELIYKFIGGILSVGSGLSLGRGGPSIQLGSQIAYGVRKIFKGSNVNEKFLISSGISAGLSAAFSSPLAGIIFTIEEIHKYLTPVLLICISLASISAEVVTQFILGDNRLFDFKGIIPNSLDKFENFIFIFIFAILISILGVIFTTSLLKFQKFYLQLKLTPLFKSLVIFAISITVGIFILDIQGVGYKLILKTGHETFSFKLIAALLLGKLIFTILSNGPGFPGGLFLPSLVLGALSGNLFGLLLEALSSDNKNLQQYFMVLGMAAFFTAVMRTPLTGNILLLEMTGSFDYLSSLILVTTVSYITTELMGIRPITSVLYENLEKSKNIHRKELSKNSTIFSSPILGGSWLDDMEVSKVKWPHDSLLIKIKRDSYDIIPKGNTKILSGDTLFILTNQAREKELKPIIFDLGTKPKST